MAIESVSGAGVSASLNTQFTQRTPTEDPAPAQTRPPEQPAEETRTQTSQAVQQASESEAPRPTVNSEGQTVGQLVNTTA